MKLPNLSASFDSAAQTGPVRFGNVYLAQAGGSNGLSWGWVLAAGIAVWWFFIRKK